MRYLIPTLVLCSLPWGFGELECAVDDLIVDMNVADASLTLLRLSPCTTVRNDLAYAQDPTADLPPATSFLPLNTRLEPPFCLALYFKALPPHFANENASLLYIYDDTASEIGSIDVDSSGITFTFRGASAFFPGDFHDDYQQLQFCADGTDLELYSSCTTLLGTQDFPVTEGAPTDGIMTLFREIGGGGTFFNGEIQQLYVIECPDLSVGTVVSAQCIAVPQDCTEPIVGINNVCAALVCMPFQLRLPMEHCTVWSLEKVQAIMDDIQTQTVNAVNEYSNFTIPTDSIRGGKLSCRDSPLYVTYRAEICGTLAYSVEEVLTSIEEWVSTSPTIVAGPYIVDIDPTCTIRISSLTDPECPPPEIRTLEDEVLITKNPTAISCIDKCGSRRGLVSTTCRD